MSILQMSLSIPTPSRDLSSLRVLNGSDQQSLISRISQLSIHTVTFPGTTTIIRMGGGPRTFPGGVSKWQWKRMQAKKAKQLLKARLCRERQVYEMRKRAELRAAVSELEKPWEVVERAPTLFSVRADEQLKTLADRFQRPGGYDLWTERDGPQLFQTVDGLPSARFFPKGVVHSVKPYGSIVDSSDSVGLYTVEDAKESNMLGFVQEAETGGSVVRRGNGSRKSRRSFNSGGRAGSGNETKAGNGDLSSRSKNGLVENFYSQNSRIPGRRKDRVAITEASGNINERQKSGMFYGNRTGKGSPCDILKNKENKANFGSGGLSRMNSGKATFHTEGRGEIPVHNGRYNSGNRWFNTGKSSRKSKGSHAGEVFNMSLQQDGSYELQQDRLNAKTLDAVELDLA